MSGQPRNPDDWPPVMDVTSIDRAGNLFRLRVSAPSGELSAAMTAGLLEAARVTRYPASPMRPLP